MTEEGVMSYAVSLQMQCYMFIVGHLDELPSDVIALLPIGIRRKLLLMLPAVDICKLEETPVTDGISMDDEIWKLKCDHDERSKKFSTLVEDMTLTWKDFYICDMTMAYHNLLLLPNIHVPVEYNCTGNIQGLNFAKSGRAVLPDRYKTYQHSSSELLKLLVDSHISFKAIELGAFLINFVGTEIPVECVPLLEKLFNSVIKVVIGYTVDGVPVAVVEKLLNIIFTNPSCQVKYLNVCDLDVILPLISPLITNNPHCKLKNIKLYDTFVKGETLDMLYCILDSQDELEKLEIRSSLENFKYSIFSRPTFKELTIIGVGVSMDPAYVYMQQFFLSPYPVTLKFYGATISHPRHLQISSLQSHPTQYSKTLELSYCYVSEEILPSTVHLKKLVLNGANCVKCFSKLDNITVDECITVSTYKMDDLNDLFHITTAKEWNINVQWNINVEATEDKFIVALTNIKGVVTKLCIVAAYAHMSSIAEAIFTSLQSSLSQLELIFYHSSDVRQLYEIWKQCGSIQLKKLKLRGNHDDDDTVRDIVALISKTT